MLLQRSSKWTGSFAQKSTRINPPLQYNNRSVATVVFSKILQSSTRRKNEIKQETCYLVHPASTGFALLYSPYISIHPSPVLCPTLRLLRLSRHRIGPLCLT